ncbi:hypothetical protein [Noviherbaspirillum saxi]|uniref:Pyridoxamine 5'-phosphate oxidase putative domain-containing protein n=1 Tax=Noviherbaspirillum saxi TaxID=2320863 RepID=A0A3A3FKQ6_9BURK|nr:hypothetical protein [Noviherbaspirillum saxi]RJF96108.1 hypothetical protein D3871_22490 [Noviherbaspirillum saxi]
MPIAHEPLVDAGHADFLQCGISICIGACDRDLTPTLARGTGCRVAPDRRTVTVFLSATQGALVLRAVRDNGVISVVFSQPSTHKTVQLKGRDTAVAGLQPGDADIIGRYRDAFARELEPLGFGEVLIQTLLACPPADLVGLTFTPCEAYSQTPGPKAGEPLKADT